MKTSTKTSQFRLKKHADFRVVILSNGITQEFNNQNITDQIALAYLRAEPVNGIHDFAAYPENWKELLLEQQASDETTPEDLVINTPIAPITLFKPKPAFKNTAFPLPNQPGQYQSVFIKRRKQKNSIRGIPIAPCNI